MPARILLRRDTSANWDTNNPVLSLGEPGVETDTLRVKLGDGVSDWQTLDYAISLDFADLQNTPTTVSGYGITDALNLTALSVQLSSSSGGGTLVYDDDTGEFTFTPPDLSSFISLDDLSTQSNAASGTGALSYDSSTGIFTYTPPDTQNIAENASIAFSIALGG